MLPLSPRLLGLSAVSLLALHGCAAKPPAAPPPPQVRLVNPLPFVSTDSSTIQSTLEAIQEVQLAPEIGGRIVALPVLEGQPVRPGQLLFVLDQQQQRAEVNADAAEAQKDRVNAERYIFLNQQGAVSSKDRDFYVTQAIQSRDRLRASIATLGYKNVVAPITGQVGNLNAKLGDVVQAGSAVTSIVDNSRLWVRLDIPGEDAWRVRPGMPVELTAPDRPQLRAVGRVNFVAPSLDREKQTLLVKALFDNANGALRNRQRVNARLIYGQRSSLAIPEQAVLLQAGQTFVFVAVRAEEASRRLGRPLDPPPPAGLPVALQVPVRLGVLENGAFPVLAGLSRRDVVIVGNLARLRSGMAVSTVGGMAAGAAAGGSPAR